MENSNNTLQFEDDTLELLIYENSENLPPNDQSVEYNDDTVDNNSNENLNIRISDNKNNLRENTEEPITQTKRVYKVLEDSYMNYSDCGEPFKPQHIRIDFTPIPGVDDNAFVQKKCVDFWKFVNEHQMLQSFEIAQVSRSSAKENVINKTSGDQGSFQDIEVAAVKYLQRPGPLLDFGSRSRLSNQIIKSSIIKSRGLDEVKMLCHKMEEWDLAHPKSMESPHPVPSREDLKSCSSCSFSTPEISSHSSSLNDIK